MIRLVYLQHLKRSLPYLQVLHQGIKSPKQKIEILKKFPDFVLQDIVEILFNAVHNNCKCPPSHAVKLKRHRVHVEQLLNGARRNKKFIRRYFHKQKGGFLGVLLPTIFSIISSLFTKDN
jgi:hypothetical protein